MNGEEKKRMKSVVCAGMVILAVAGCATAPAAIVTTTYEFIPDQSTVVVYGGWGGRFDYSIEGHFQLTVDFNAGIASFSQVDATISEVVGYYEEGEFRSTDSLGVLFHMTELESTYVSDAQIDFLLERNIPTFPGADIHIVLTFMDDSVHLTGNFGEPIVDGAWYDLDAVAVPEAATLYYVDADASGANDGSSWADAYNYLQDALAVALSGDEIWAAQGIYKPDQGVGITPGGRMATFQLINGVTLRGSYAGFGELDPNARDIELYETILSGDLNGDDIDVNDPCDLLTEPTRGENSYHVVTGSEMDATAVLDSLTLTGGCGGGMYNWDSSPTLSNCTFTGNWGGAGGGMANYNNSNPTLTNCTFIGNSAGGGGGMYNRESNPTLSGCSFIGNWAGFGGGGIYSDWSSPIIANCTISENIAAASFGHGGGGLAFFRGSPTITNCVISGNRSSWLGGGVCYLFGSGVPSEGISITGCIITGNKAKQDGGGIFCSSYITKIANCTFGGNAAQWGGGMYNASWHTTLTNCTFSRNSAEESGGGICNGGLTLTITNCILWADTPEEIGYFFVSVTSVLTYCDVEGGWPGEGNIDVEPCFVETGYWDANGVWIDGDYHLLPDSPCIDAGDPNYVAEPNETDLDGKPRIIGGRIDMGAYEYSPPIPAEVRIVPRTINLTSKGKWITCYIWLGEEYDAADIELNSVVLEGEIQAELLWLDEEQQVAIVRFSRSEVQGILNAGQVELTISGELTDGTVFEGTAVIRVIDKGKKK